MHRDLRVFKPDSRPGPKGQKQAAAAAAAAHAAAEAEAEARRAVPHTSGGSRGGLGGSYYYGAVGTADRTVPVEPPRKLSPEEAAAAAAARSGRGGGSGGGRAGGAEQQAGVAAGGAGAAAVPGRGYYYAHGRAEDHKVVVVSRTIGADGAMREWAPHGTQQPVAQPGGPAAPPAGACEGGAVGQAESSKGGAAAREEAEGAAAAALVDELRARGADVAALKTLARQVAAGAGGTAPVSTGGGGDATGRAGEGGSTDGGNGGNSGVGILSARELLASMLRQAGYAKLGQRKAMEAALLEVDSHKAK